MVSATADGVAGWGVRSLTPAPTNSPVSRSTIPPLIPLPPTSMPNPRRCGVPEAALVPGVSVAESVLVKEISLARFGLFHTLAGDDAVAFVAEPGKRAGRLRSPPP